MWTESHNSLCPDDTKDERLPSLEGLRQEENNVVIVSSDDEVEIISATPASSRQERQEGVSAPVGPIVSKANHTTVLKVYS